MVQSDDHKTLDFVVGVSELFEKFIMSGCILVSLVFTNGLIKVIGLDVESILFVPIGTFLCLFDVQISYIVEFKHNIVERFSSDIKGSQYVISGAVEQGHNL